MVLVNYTTRELTAKLVYYGPGLCGKTTNLQYIYENLMPPDRRGKMVSLDTETDRTLFFDFLPIEIGTIRGLKTRLQLYTVPGQVHYNATRKIVLKGADGIVFVADSQATARDGNIESYRNMKANLAEHGLDLRNVPFVLQFNKRDLPNVMSVDQMVTDLNEYNVPFWEATAIEGIGVEDTLKGLVRLVMKNLAGRFQADGKEAAAAPAPAVAAAPAPAPPAPVVTPPAAPAPPLPPVAAPAPPTAPPAAPALSWPAPPAAAAAAPATPAATASAGPLDLELSLEPEAAEAEAGQAGGEEIFELGSDQLLEPDEPSADEAALASGDTIFAPAAGSQPEPAAPSFEPAPRVSPSIEAALLSGDTVMSDELSVGLVTEAPATLSPPAARMEPPAPPSAPPPAPPVSAGADLEENLFGSDEPPGLASMDLEDNLFGGGMLAESPPAPARPPSAPTPPSQPEPPLAPSAPAPPAAAPAEAEPVAEVEVPLQLGRIETGELVRRIVRIPVEFEDASGKRSTTLTVRIEFRVD